MNNEQRTLDAQHSKNINILTTERSQIDKLKNELKKLEKEYKKLDKKKVKERSFADNSRIGELRKIIEDHKNKINDIETNNNISNYWCDVYPVLDKYYNKEDIVVNEYFDNDNEEANNTEEDDSNINIVHNSNKNITMDLFFKKTNDYNDKADMLDHYMSLTDQSYTPEFTKKVKIPKCVNCNIECMVTPTDGILVCQSCGDTMFTMIENDKPNYKEPIQDTSYFCYKRINHFNEWLSQFQAKETTEIPQIVYDLIISEIGKMRIIDVSKLTNKIVRDILKKHKMNKYYEHIPHIINKINDLPPPIMSVDVENKLRRMFKEIQEPFMEVCPKDRKNFMSYSYVLHKMCELLELDQFLSCFPLLKSRQKLHGQDIIWKKICNILRWEFIPSI